MRLPGSMDVSPHRSEKLSPIQVIPLDVLAKFYEYLSYPYAVAFSLTCTQLFYSTIGNAAVKRLVRRAERFELLCLLEIDGVVKGYRCQGCFKKHPKKDFSHQQLQARPTERYCLHTAKSLRLSNGIAFSYDDIHALRRYGRMYSAVTSINHDMYICIYAPGPCLKDETIIDITFPLCFSGQFFGNSRDAFGALCSQYILPVCPHTWTNDERILSQYPSPAGEVIPVEGDKKYPTCPQCKTRLILRERTLRNERNLVELLVRRYLGPLSSPFDKQWLSHTYGVEDPLLDEYCATTEERRNTYLRGDPDEIKSLQSVPPEVEGLPKNLASSSAMAANQWRLPKIRLKKRQVFIQDSDPYPDPSFPKAPKLARTGNDWSLGVSPNYYKVHSWH